ncbi:MAG: class B sortase [Lachnospiraceae bacterium]|nr:class B sortase [Lachnospiraceae bacterium]
MTENELKDKQIIDELRKKYNLRDKKDLDECYAQLQNIQFYSDLGRKFDDYIFDLKNSDEVADINNKTEIKKTKSSKSSVQRDKEIDKKIDAAAIKELKKRNKRTNIVVAFLLMLSVGSIAYFIVYYKDAYEVQRQAQEYADLKDDGLSQYLSVEQVLKKEYTEEVVIPEILDEYKALYNKNKSLIGWIKIDGTKIDYPVMQTVNNEYYLKHNFDQKEDANGSIFLDTNCDIITGCTNMIVYGHHMKSGKMFGSLINYGSKDYYDKHDTIYFDTIYEKGKYQIMYVFRSHIYNSDEITFKYYQFIQANSETEFDSAMEEMSRLSLYDTGVTAQYGDQLLTLSTCDYQEANGRFVVVAKRVY